MPAAGVDDFQIISACWIRLFGKELLKGCGAEIGIPVGISVGEVALGEPPDAELDL